MTLKEKFELYAKQEVWEKRNYNAEECVDISNEFAIEFLKWFIYNNNNEYIMYPNKSIEEQLVIFKKEKGL